jgi:hypothetical protein
VLGEATDHITQTEVNQSEVDQMNAALSQASAQQNSGGKRSADPASKCSGFTDLLKQVPGTGGLIQEAIQLQAASDAQAAENERAASGQGYDSSYAPYDNQYDRARANNAPNHQFQGPPGSQGGPPGPGIPGVSANIDPQQAMAKIYPFLAFRDKVVRNIAAIVAKIPGLEKAIETISEKVTLFIMGLLAPFIKPIIAAASNALKQGSGTVVDASAKQQFIVWTDPTSSDPTHSVLSKDHFSNILNPPAGQLASTILKYVAPRVIYGWENPDVSEQEILNDVGRVFHHPATRDHNLEIHREMFAVVEKWARSRPHNAPDLNNILSSESVKAGKNHQVQDFSQSVQGFESQLHALGTSSHSATAGGPLANFLGGSRRDLDFDSGIPSGSYGDSTYGGAPQDYNQPPQQPTGYNSEDPGAYPTAYQQGYEAPYNPMQQQQQPYQGSYDQQNYQQGGYGGYQGQGYNQGGGYGSY